MYHGLTSQLNLPWKEEIVKFVHGLTNIFAIASKEFISGNQVPFRVFFFTIPTLCGLSYLFKLFELVTIHLLFYGASALWD